jgi:predicted RNase H-like HicB family nuclease
MQFAVVLHPAGDGDYWSEVPSLPGCGSQGHTLDETVANTRNAIAGWLAYLHDKGRPLPLASGVVVTVEVP